MKKFGILLILLQISVILKCQSGYYDYFSDNKTAWQKVSEIIPKYNVTYLRFNSTYSFILNNKKYVISYDSSSYDNTGFLVGEKKIRRIYLFCQTDTQHNVWTKVSDVIFSDYKEKINDEDIAFDIYYAGVNDEKGGYVKIINENSVEICMVRHYRLTKYKQNYEPYDNWYYHRFILERKKYNETFKIKPL